MNFKPTAYHWTTEMGLEETGIPIVGGGAYGQGVYLSINPEEFYNKHGRTHLYGIDIRGLEDRLLAIPEKKWMLSIEDIPSPNIFFIGKNFNTKEQIREVLNQKKEEFLKTYHRKQEHVKKHKIKHYECNILTELKYEI